ncbi:hypothetical protein E0I61_09685 [Flavobacterium ranwuense]|uniref:Molybdopterin synthase sulfur carrier subunit n=1 Tax=Flavobacterium ranwuense TaxID=2541725 RepID=A0ABY2DWJ5_9FLAO|nr:hypothetical protein [Flavobacterium ranwuense]TDE29418.1 hypothetical protein E0I61_09685 [Flavobacterium ranwuense]
MTTKKIQIKFPVQIAKFINNIKEVEFEGESIIDLLNHLENTYGNVLERLLDENNEVRPYFNLYLGENNINTLNGLSTKVVQNDKISLLLSRAGG